MEDAKSLTAKSRRKISEAPVARGLGSFPEDPLAQSAS